MKIRQGKDIILRWKITTNGEALPLEGRNLTLILSTPNGRERVLSYTTEGDTISTRLFGKEITLLGDYTLTLWENRGEQGQTAVDAVNAFELVKYTTMEEDGSSCGNLEAEVLNLSGELGVFQQGTTAEKNEQVDKNTEDIAELQQDMADAKDDIHALGNSLDELGKADASLREEIVNIKDKNAEQDEEITSLLNILEGKLDIKDLGSGLRPDQAVSEIINYVRSNNIKSALVFKYIDTDNSSTFGICISRMGTSGWIIYLVARKGLEVLKFNSRGSRETWNEYGGVLRHDMNSVADEQLECLSIKGIKSVLATKQDALISGQNIRTINGKDILGSGDIEFMPATPSGDPMHWAYVSAGAEYNATNNFDIKDAPWKDMVDTIEDKAKWSLDVVDASKVQQMTIKGVEYNYATENRTSPEGGTYLRYFLVGQGSNDFWVEDETKVLHLPKCWYLNGLGDITDAEMKSIYAVKHMSYAPTGGFAGTPCRTFIDRIKHTGSDITCSSRYHRCKKVESIYSYVHRVANGGFNYTITTTTALRYFLPTVTLISHTDKLYGALGDAALRVMQIGGVRTHVQIPSKYISKQSILYAINNAAPTSALSITLHPDAYARLAEDADIVAALEAKPLVTLVSA